MKYLSQSQDYLAYRNYAWVLFSISLLSSVAYFYMILRFLYKKKHFIDSFSKCTITIYIFGFFTKTIMWAIVAIDL